MAWLTIFIAVLAVGDEVVDSVGTCGVWPHVVESAADQAASVTWGRLDFLYGCASGP